VVLSSCHVGDILKGQAFAADHTVFAVPGIVEMSHSIVMYM